MDCPSGSVEKDPPGQCRRCSSILGSWRSPGEGNGNLFQYSYLENPTDRGAWQATVHGVTSRTQLRACEHMHAHSRTHTHTLFQIVINVCFVFFIILYLLGIITSVYLQGIITTNSCVTTSWVKTDKILEPWKAPSYHFPIIVHFLLYKRNRHPGFYGNHFPGFSL